MLSGIKKTYDVHVGKLHTKLGAAVWKRYESYETMQHFASGSHKVEHWKFRFPPMWVIRVM
jgi:hypothetical protein